MGLKWHENDFWYWTHFCSLLQSKLVLLYGSFKKLPKWLVHAEIHTLNGLENKHCHYQLNKSLNDKSRDEKIFVLYMKLNYIGKTILKVLDDFFVFLLWPFQFWYCCISNLQNSDSFFVCICIFISNISWILILTTWWHQPSWYIVSLVDFW